MFSTLQPAPPDAILGITEAFKKDPNPRKINLSVGVYQDATGKTPVLRSVKKAEERLLREETSKSYMPIDGAPEYAAAVKRLLFGAEHEFTINGRAVTAHTPGGTGALRVAADFIKQINPKAAVWLSGPTWPNHPGVFQAACLAVKTYPYYNADRQDLDFPAMTAALDQVPEGDIVLFHGCCHNPSGLDPSPAQWASLADLATKRRFIPFFDFAYQGFADGIDADAAGLRLFLEKCNELFIASSFSKNFGLYNERVGALTIIAEDADRAAAAQSHVKRTIRSNYSNPPAHGGLVVTRILADPELRAEWEREVGEMRDRINGIRKQFVDTLKAKGVKRDFSFLARQRGMFSFSGLTREQVLRLRDEYAIYIVENGRINVAGITPANLDLLCEAIRAVV